MTPLSVRTPEPCSRACSHCTTFATKVLYGSRHSGGETKVKKEKRLRRRGPRESIDSRPLCFHRNLTGAQRNHALDDEEVVQHHLVPQNTRHDTTPSNPFSTALSKRISPGKKHPHTVYHTWDLRESSRPPDPCFHRSLEGGSRSCAPDEAIALLQKPFDMT